jgi:hypothetical protein
VPQCEQQPQQQQQLPGNAAYEGAPSSARSKHGMVDEAEQVPSAMVALYHEYILTPNNAFTHFKRSIEHLPVPSLVFV